MVFAGLDLKSCHKILLFTVPHHKSRIDITLDAIGVSIELLLCCDELFEPQLVLILVGKEHLIKPSRNVLDGLV